MINRKLLNRALDLNCDIYGVFLFFFVCYWFKSLHFCFCRIFLTPEFDQGYNYRVVFDILLALDALVTVQGPRWVSNYWMDQYMWLYHFSAPSCHLDIALIPRLRWGNGKYYGERYICHSINKYYLTKGTRL